MKKYLVLATLFLMTSTASAANITWHGGVDYRYSNLNQNDNLSTQAVVNNSNESQSELTTKSHMWRMSLGATGGWDNIEWGATVGTRGINGGVTNTTNSDWVNTQHNAAGVASDFPIAIREAWFRYGNDWGFGDLGFTFGKQALPFALGKQQIFMDSDVRMDGFSQTWKWGSFGLNMGQYILGAVNGNAANSSFFADRPFDEATVNNQDGFMALYGFQMTFDWRFNDDFSMMFAGGFYKWNRTLGAQFQNFIPNTRNLTNTASAGINGADATFATSQENSRPFVLMVDFDLPYSLNLEFEIAFNREMQYGRPANIGAVFAPFVTGLNIPASTQDSTAWSLGLTYGELKKSQDFVIGYAYHDKGLGAVSNAFTYDRNPAGYSGHHVWVGYNLANNFNVGFKYISLSEKDPRNQDGVAVIGGEKIDREYWEITTGVHL